MSDPRDAADEAARRSGLKHALSLIAAHMVDGPEKTLVLRALIGACEEKPRPTDPPATVVAGERLRAQAAAAELRTAADIIARCMPPGRNQTDCLRRIDLERANLLTHDSRAICRRCGVVFEFDSARFRARGFDLPRHCFTCRQARRDERDNAGVVRDRGFG